MSSPATDRPRLLILETSGRVGRVAVALGDQLGPQRVLEASRRHARDLAPAIRELCHECSWRVRDLYGVIVSRGPGSYTGLRVGIMTAKTIAYATGCKLFAIDTFAAIAAAAPTNAATVDVVSDAQQCNLYVQRFERRSGELTALTGLTIQASAEWLRTLPIDVWVTGPGTALVEGQLPAGQPCIAVEDRESSPQRLLELGLRCMREGTADDFWTVEPLYLRPSNAETNWDKRA
jgi:tRNA threonylcarbamoyladenosine biosynthesis protein TsaB